MLSDLRRCWVLMAVTVVLAAACSDDGERDPVVCANANDIGFTPDLSDFNAVVGLPE